MTLHTPQRSKNQQCQSIATAISRRQHDDSVAARPDSTAIPQKYHNNISATQLHHPSIVLPGTAVVVLRCWCANAVVMLWHCWCMVLLWCACSRTTTPHQYHISTTSVPQHYYNNQGSTAVAIAKNCCVIRGILSLLSGRTAVVLLRSCRHCA